MGMGGMGGMGGGMGGMGGGMGGGMMGRPMMMRTAPVNFRAGMRISPAGMSRAGARTVQRQPEMVDWRRFLRLRQPVQWDKK